jgi:lycopene cyclase domain-containing protein
MTYLAFHFVFILPAIVLLWATLPRPLAQVGGWRARAAIPLLSAIAFTYTTPWDNYLVAREVWWYGPERVVATIGHVPVEEYAFFVLQPILTGLFLYHVLSRTDLPRQVVPESSVPAFLGTAFWAGVSLLGFGMLFADWTDGLYMGLILAWAAPILAGMWLYDGGMLWSMHRTVGIAVGLPTVYLWVADAAAIHLGIWTISSEFTLGLEPFGLPVEEATFFLMTNLLVVKGILLLLFGDHQAIPSEHERPVENASERAVL